MNIALSGKFASKVLEKMKAKKYHPIELFVSKEIPIYKSNAVTHEIVFNKNERFWYNQPEYIQMGVDMLKEQPHHDGFPSWYDSIELHCLRKTRNGENAYKTSYNTKTRRHGSPQKVICFTITRQPTDLPLSNMVDQLKAALHTMYRLPSHKECADRFVDQFVENAPGLVKHIFNLNKDDDIPEKIISDLKNTTAKNMKEMTLKAPDVTYDCPLDTFFMDDSIRRILTRNKHKDLTSFSIGPMKTVLYKSGKLPAWNNMVYIHPPT
jgi:hypothetical protein